MAKSRKAVAKVIGPIIHQGLDELLWKVRLIAPYFPFHIDSALCFRRKEDAEKFAEKWRRKKIVVEITR